MQASVLVFLYEITADSLHQLLIIGIASFLAMLLISAFFVVVFPCRPSHVWEIMGDQCINQLSFWEAFAGVNLVIESALILLPVVMVYPVMMDRRKKVIVISGFAARLLYVPNVGIFALARYITNIEKGNWSFHSADLRSAESKVATY